MASPTIRLDYWDGDSWEQALTHTGKNAVISVNITKTIDAPAQAEVVLSNKSKNYSSTTTSKAATNSSQGYLTGIFTDFMDCRLRDEETGVMLFRGRVLEEQNQYNLMQGSTIRLQLRDMLFELAQHPLDNVPVSLRAINIDSGTTDSRSEIIAHIVSKVSDNFSTSDTAKFEPSLVDLTANEKKTGDFTGANNSWDIAKEGKSQILRTIHSQAMAEPHASSNNEHFGFDFYVDPSFTSLATDHKPDVDINYFRRGTRPGAGGSTSADPSKHGLTIEHPSAGWAGKTNFSKPMLNNADFDTTTAQVYSSVITHFNDRAYGEDDTTNREQEAIETFELVSGTIPSGHAFAYSGKRLRYINDGSPHNPELLYKAGSNTPCATVHYQSGTGSGKYLILGNVYDEATTVQYTNETGLAFEAFPTDSSTIRLFNAAAGSYSNSSTPTDIEYIDIVPSTARLKKKLAFNKPYRLQTHKSISVDLIRAEIAGILDTTSQGSVTRARFSLIRYPMSRLEAAAAKVSRSTNVITYASAAFTLADASGTTNNPLTFGVKKGMAIAELDAAGKVVTRYSYISAVDATTATYGASATDTSDGTALDASKPIAIYIPAEPGHVVKVKNKIWDKSYNILIEKIDYSYTNGMITANLTGIGMDTNAEGIPITVPSTRTVDVDMPTSLPAGAQQWTIPDGYIKAKDHNTIEIVEDSGSTVTVLTHPTGNQYVLKGGDHDLATSGDAAYEWHTLFLRPLASQNVASPLSTDRQDMQVIASTASSTNYTKIADPRGDIIFGRAKANRDTNAVAVLELYGTTGSVTSDANVSSAGEVLSGTANAARVVHNSAGISAFNAAGTRVLNIIPGSGATTNGRITVGQEGVANMNYIQIYGGDNSSQGGVIFADPDSGTESSDGSQYIQFDHNSAVSGNSSSSNTTIYRQGSGAVGEISQGGRNLIIKDNGAETLFATSSDDSTDNILGAGSYLKLFNIVPVAPRYYAQTHTVQSQERAGSRAKPVYTFYGDDDTGMYSSSPGYINFTCDNTAVIQITASEVEIMKLFKLNASLGGNTGTLLVLDSNNYLRESTSSKKYKENIVDLKINSEKLYNLRPVNFKYKDVQVDNKPKLVGSDSFGYIAEEVHEVLPEVVNYKNNEPHDVSYQLLSVLLVEEVKKLKQDITKLQQQING